MGSDVPAEQLIGLVADERLLNENPAMLPAALGLPEPIPTRAARRRLVGVGATLTGVTLIGGIALAILGAVELLFDGGGALAVVALVVGLVLASTHWGWVHVAELTANSIEGRSNAEVEDRRRQWLATIQPYSRFEIYTRVEEDGSITIYRVAHRPVASGERGFTFDLQTEYEEVHPPDEPAAEVTERAELLRRQAAQDTERERERYQIAADAYESVLLDDADEQQRRLARRAASEALSKQINSNLRDPPLLE